MAKAVAKPKKIAAKSKSSMPVRAKPAPSASARKALKKSPVKPVGKGVAAKAVHARIDRPDLAPLRIPRLAIPIARSAVVQHAAIHGP